MTLDRESDPSCTLPGQPTPIARAAEARDEGAAAGGAAGQRSEAVVGSDRRPPRSIHLS